MLSWSNFYQLHDLMVTLMILWYSGEERQVTSKDLLPEKRHGHKKQKDSLERRAKLAVLHTMLRTKLC